MPTSCPAASGREWVPGFWHTWRRGFLRVRSSIVGTYRANYKARGNLEKAGYSLSEDPVAVLRAYYDIPEDRLRTSVTYEKKLDG